MSDRKRTEMWMLTQVYCGLIERDMAAGNGPKRKRDKVPVVVDRRAELDEEARDMALACAGPDAKEWFSW